MSFVFYDTETTGIDTSFDQILQFAAIRTDPNFNEIDRFEIRCRLLDRVVVAPGALRVTGMSIRQLVDRALPSHFEMINTIQRRLASWAPAVFVGYNSLNFDEHLLRSALWKSLHRPYLTNTDGNMRADAMRVVQAVAGLRPGVLAIPMKEKNRPSYKLEDVARANGFDHVNAHDALGDVEATIHLCKLIAEKDPDIWSAFMRFAQKAAVVDFITTEPVFGLIENYFGRVHAFVLTVLGRNPENASEFYAFDLSVDPAELASLAEDALASRLKRSPKPVRRIKANAAPFLTELDETPDTANGRNLPVEELQRRAAAVSPGTSLAHRIFRAAEAMKEPKDVSPHIEKQIYDGFSSDADMSLCASFHGAAWEERLEIVKRFEDGRLREWAKRVIYDERPDLLSEDERQAERRSIAERLLSSESDLPWSTLPRAIAECTDLIATLTGAEAELLAEYLSHCEERQKELLLHL